MDAASSQIIETGLRAIGAGLAIAFTSLFQVVDAVQVHAKLIANRRFEVTRHREIENE